MTYYAADGSINISVVAGNAITGLLAPDGSLNVVASPGGSYVGLYHPCGAVYITPVTDTTLRPLLAPDGSLYITNTGMPPKDQGQPVTAVSGNPFNVIPGPFLPWLFI